MKYGCYLLTVISLIILTSCTKINSSPMVITASNAPWGMAIFTNNTEVPQAGYRAMNITAGVLRSKGVQQIAMYPASSNCSKLILCPNATPTVKQVLTWARSKHLVYVMMGAVNEWDYKVGLDGEPIVGVSLQVYHVPSACLIWSSVGSKMGTSRSGLAVIAQNLIVQMLMKLRPC